MNHKVVQKKRKKNIKVRREGGRSGGGRYSAQPRVDQSTAPAKEGKNGSLSITNVKELIGTKMSRGAEDKRQTREGRNTAGRASGGQ